ncbi:MAG: hypothetical protein ABI169_09915, partial [Chitinophagaceae bacterium]
TDVQYASLSGVPYLEKQSVSLGNHLMYGSSRLGIAQYQPSQYNYTWDYEYGLIDTFGLTQQRAWYSYGQNAVMDTGTTSPYGHEQISASEADHIIGQKQYELVNHLGNVQETVSDKKYSKDLNDDSMRDEYRAASVMVYDYYPFGELMPGRSLDTAGLCVTRNIYQEVPQSTWFNGGPLDGSGGGSAATAVGAASISSGTGTGIDVGGASGGIQFTISGITAWSIYLQPYFNFISGIATVTLWQGTTVGTGGVQIASTTTGVISPAASIGATVRGTPTSPATITVVITMPAFSAPPTGNLFNLDSIGYTSYSYLLTTGTYTQCGSPVDKYEFGYNGQMKSNEIAGVGNHLDFKFRGYDSRIGRFWSVDPLTAKYAWNGVYNFAEDRPIDGGDLEGSEWISKTTDNSTKFTTTVCLINRSKVYSQSDVIALKPELQKSFNTVFSKEVDCKNYSASLMFASPDEVKGKQTIYVFLEDKIIEPDQDGKITYKAGETFVAEGNNNASQNNVIHLAVSLNGEKLSIKEIALNNSHELGHTGGLPHPWKKGNEEENRPQDMRQPDKGKKVDKNSKRSIETNIMNSSENPNESLRTTDGLQVTPGQLNQIKNVVEQQQPK